MKKLIFLFLSVIAAGSLFQACDNSKTYAEMLEDEKNAVNKFIKDSAINVISLEEFGIQLPICQEMNMLLSQMASICRL